jgi:hypothetical protein
VIEDFGYPIPLDIIASKTLDYLAFQYFDFERT